MDSATTLGMTLLVGSVGIALASKSAIDNLRLTPSDKTDAPIRSVGGAQFNIKTIEDLVSMWLLPIRYDRLPYEPDDQHEKEVRMLQAGVLVCEDVTRQGQRPQPRARAFAKVILSGRRSEDLRVALLKMDSIFVAAGRMNNPDSKLQSGVLLGKDPDMQLAIEVPRVVFKASSASAWLKKQGVTHMPKKLQAQIDRIRDAQALYIVDMVYGRQDHLYDSILQVVESWAVPPEEETLEDDMIDWDTIPDCDLRTAEQWEGIIGEIYSATRVDDEDDNLSVCISQDSLHDIQDQMSKSLQPVMEDARKYMLKKYVDPSIADRLKPLEKYVSGGFDEFDLPEPYLSSSNNWRHSLEAPGESNARTLYAFIDTIPKRMTLALEEAMESEEESS
jgi:hypothetical protein